MDFFNLSLRVSKFYIYELSYNLNTVLCKFLETGTSDMPYRYRSFPEILRFRPIPSFIFRLQSFILISERDYSKLQSWLSNSLFLNL